MSLKPQAYEVEAAKALLLLILQKLAWQEEQSLELEHLTGIVYSQKKSSSFHSCFSFLMLKHIFSLAIVYIDLAEHFWSAQ